MRRWELIRDRSYFNSLGPTSHHSKLIRKLRAFALSPNKIALSTHYIFRCLFPQFFSSNLTKNENIVVLEKKKSSFSSGSYIFQTIRVHILVKDI